MKVDSFKSESGAFMQSAEEVHDMYRLSGTASHTAVGHCVHVQCLRIGFFESHNAFLGAGHFRSSHIAGDLECEVMIIVNIVHSAQVFHIDTRLDG